MHNKNYRLQDLLNDESFQKYVAGNDENAAAYWSQWMKDNPERKSLVDSAARVIKGLEFKKAALSEEQISKEWQNLKVHIERENEIQIDTIERFSPFRHYRQIAAIFIGILICGGIFFSIKSSKIARSTGYGEQLTVTLPDESTVVLNGNSTLRYSKKWDDGNSREVWLDGDAYFSVRKRPGRGSAKFLVHTSKITVEVLGTTFNVSNRRGKTKVVLNTGKVKIKGETKSGPSNLYMKPGELVEYSESTQTFTKTSVSPEIYTSWTKKKLVFDETPLMEIAQILEENYGLEVEIYNHLLRDKKLTGEISIENADELLTALSKSFDIKITRDDKKVRLEINE